ncbi:hypothetical protein ACFY9F_35975 [Streptomyces sp. NPDC012421]|uniref:hypothetical protein n=1 Tax=Streptomyces sp. NPDC012421 TaxID=3364832 RepID=UPI0036EA5545
MVTTQHTRARAAGLGGALALALTLTACAKDNDIQATPKAPAQPSVAPTTTTAPATTPADPQAAEKAAVLAAFGGMWAEQHKANAKANSKGTALRKYTTLDALSKIENNLGRMRTAGIVIRGRLGHTGDAVTTLDLTPKTPKAVVTTCVDLSEYERYDTRDKKVIPMPSGQPARYLMTVTVEKWPTGWIVTDLQQEGARPC